jgi:Fe-Mn family superoxide dismutase
MSSPATLVRSAVPPVPAAKSASAGPFIQAPLPYAIDALAPVISAGTLRVHYGDHHKAYIDKLNKLVEGTPSASLSIRQILLDTADVPDKATTFDNAAQAWNHEFYWHSLQPHGGGTPRAALRKRIDSSFGTLDVLKTELYDAATTQFGSGWAWLVLDGPTLRVIKTDNAGNPLTRQQTPLLTIDVWEHAYYLDYQSHRPDYVHGVIDKLLNWDFASANFDAV